MALSVELYRTAFLPDQLVTDNHAQIVFAGRSNVGKSSLLNALFGRTLAKTSSTPGKTQSVNYYALKDRPLYLVDLPGYGFARAGKEAQRTWSSLLDSYFATTAQIIQVCVLIDSRLPPQQKDLEMLKYATEKDLQTLGVLTKTDKCSRSQIHQQIRTWEALLGTPPYATSVKNKSTVRELEKGLLDVCEEHGIQKTVDSGTAGTI